MPFGGRAYPRSLLPEMAFKYRVGEEVERQMADVYRFYQPEQGMAK